jgi:glycosyltransferase involved in cell wall biosynthesis
MKILVFPRDANPYQGLLYGEMRRLGVQVTYIGEWTPSHLLNLLLLPLETAVRRLCGIRLIHLHWVSAFAFPCAGRFPILRRVAQCWFGMWLRVCRILGMRLVWTAHNVLPHDRVFSDDVAARQKLVLASDLVVAHSKSTLASLAAIGVTAPRSTVIPHGPIAPKQPAASLRIPGSNDGPRRFLFIGRLKEYKGVDDLLAAFAVLPKNVSAHLTIAGQCDDPQLRTRLHTFAEGHDITIIVSRRRLPEEEITELMAVADVVVLPFRRITTSGSALLALSHGRPLIVPDLPAMADLPDSAVIRYDGGIPGLRAALVQLAAIDSGSLGAMSASALRYASSITWQEIAERTRSEMITLLRAILACVSTSE